MNSSILVSVRVAWQLPAHCISGFSRSWVYSPAKAGTPARLPWHAVGFGLGLLLLTTVFPATEAQGSTIAGSMFYDSWAGEVGGGPDSAWGVENLTDPNNGNVHYTNVTPSESAASNPTTLQVISDPTSPTGRGPCK